MNDRRAREQRGRRGETLAAWYLRLKGWRIVAQRVKTPRGEVDLIARRGRTVAFVEVKWRATAAAEALAPRYAKPGDDLRIDVLLLAPRVWPRHIVNASLG